MPCRNETDVGQSVDTFKTSTSCQTQDLFPGISVRPLRAQVVAVIFLICASANVVQMQPLQENPDIEPLAHDASTEPQRPNRNVPGVLEPKVIAAGMLRPSDQPYALNKDMTKAQTKPPLAAGKTQIMPLPPWAGQPLSKEIQAKRPLLSTLRKNLQRKANATTEASVSSTSTTSAIPTAVHQPLQITSVSPQPSFQRNAEQGPVMSSPFGPQLKKFRKRTKRPVGFRQGNAFEPPPEMGGPPPSPAIMEAQTNATASGSGETKTGPHAISVAGEPQILPFTHLLPTAALRQSIPSGVALGSYTPNQPLNSTATNIPVQSTELAVSAAALTNRQSSTPPSGFEATTDSNSATIANQLPNQVIVPSSSPAPYLPIPAAAIQEVPAEALSSTGAKVTVAEEVVYPAITIAHEEQRENNRSGNLENPIVQVGLRGETKGADF